MKLVPFGKDTVLQLAVISLAPVAPLVLTMIPLGELLDRNLKTRSSKRLDPPGANALPLNPRTQKRHEAIAYE